MARAINRTDRLATALKAYRITPDRNAAIKGLIDFIPYLSERRTTKVIEELKKHGDALSFCHFLIESTYGEENKTSSDRMIAAAFIALHEIDNDQEKSRALIKIAPLLYEDQIRAGIIMAEELDFSYRGSSLMGLVPFIRDDLIALNVIGQSKEIAQSEIDEFIWQNKEYNMGYLTRLTDTQISNAFENILQSDDPKKIIDRLRMLSAALSYPKQKIKCIDQAMQVSHKVIDNLLATILLEGLWLYSCSAAQKTRLSKLALGRALRVAMDDDRGDEMDRAHAFFIISPHVKESILLAAARSYRLAFFDEKASIWFNSKECCVFDDGQIKDVPNHQIPEELLEKIESATDVQEIDRLSALLKGLHDPLNSRARDAISEILADAEAGKSDRIDRVLGVTRREFAGYSKKVLAASRHRAKKKKAALGPLPGTLQWPSKDYNASSFFRKRNGIIDYLNEIWKPLINVGVVNMPLLRFHYPSTAGAIDNYLKVQPNGERRLLPESLKIAGISDLVDQAILSYPDPSARPVALASTIASRKKRSHSLNK